MTLAPIFAIGNLGRAQAALRADGQWFIRSRGLHGYWGAWSTTRKRPDAAWYNPRLGRARLPQPETKETIMNQNGTPRVDALMQKWDDDGATRGSAFVELRDLARELERGGTAPLQAGERRSQVRPKPALEFSDDDDAAAKARHWFGCLQQCAKLLDLADDTPIPSGVVDAVRTLQARLERAERALRANGFEDHGAAEWKPPLGKMPLATVVSQVGDELRVGWLRPELARVGMFLYDGAFHQPAVAGAVLPKEWVAKEYCGADWPVIKSSGIELQCVGATREQAEGIAKTLNKAVVTPQPVPVPSGAKLGPAA